MQLYKDIVLGLSLHVKPGYHDIDLAQKVTFSLPSYFGLMEKKWSRLEKPEFIIKIFRLLGAKCQNLIKGWQFINFKSANELFLIKPLNSSKSSQWHKQNELTILFFLYYELLMPAQVQMFKRQIFKSTLIHLKTNCSNTYICTNT